MFRKLVSRNSDLQALVDRGYAVAIDDAGYLVVRDVPWLDEKGDLRWGALVSKMVFVDDARVQQDDHQVFFAGGTPFGLNGAPIPNLGDHPASLAMSQASADVTVERSFSNKPKSGRFDDFKAKIDSYVGIISGPAIEKFGADPYTGRIRDTEAEPSVFAYTDSMSAKAQTVDLAYSFKDEVLAIIGLGGTGGYLLDYAVRTPVKEIRGFDGDAFHVHNAFRSPGQLTPEELGQAKAAVYQARYKGFRSGIQLQTCYIDSGSAEVFRGVTFAFVCVDKGFARAEIWDLLIKLGVPFIDVGMGLKRKHRGLSGMMRITYVAPHDPQGLRHAGLVEMSDGGDDLYRANIQIGELNAINAALAMIRYKQLRSFYVDAVEGAHLLFDVTDLKTVEGGSTTQGETSDGED